MGIIIRDRHNDHSKGAKKYFQFIFIHWLAVFAGMSVHPSSWVRDGSSPLHQSHRVAEMLSRATPTFRVALGPDPAAKTPNLEFLPRLLRMGSGGTSAS